MVVHIWLYCDGALLSQFVRDWCSEQRLSYENSLSWYSAEVRTCLPLELSLETWIFGFFSFLEIQTLYSLDYICHPDILIWISVTLSRRLRAISIKFCTVGSSQCSGTVDESPCFWLPGVNVSQKNIYSSRTGTLKEFQGRNGIREGQS